jgi:hypothetical protein
MRRCSRATAVSSIDAIDAIDDGGGETRISVKATTVSPSTAAVTRVSRPRRATTVSRSRTRPGLQFSSSASAWGASLIEVRAWA